MIREFKVKPSCGGELQSMRKGVHISATHRRKVLGSELLFNSCRYVSTIPYGTSDKRMGETLLKLLGVAQNLKQGQVIEIPAPNLARVQTGWRVGLARVGVLLTARSVGTPICKLFISRGIKARKTTKKTTGTPT
jgi:hypothetical protein